MISRLLNDDDLLATAIPYESLPFLWPVIVIRSAVMLTR